MPIRSEILRSSLWAYKTAYEQSHAGKEGAWVELQKLSGVTASNVARVAKGLQEPTLETWEKLHHGAPDAIPPPSVSTSVSSSVTLGDASADIQINVGMVNVPVFDAGAGEPSEWSDGGYPVGHSSDTITLPANVATGKTFAVKIHGDSMAPSLSEGDLALVNPQARLENGKLCFASWPEDNGRRLVKRFYRYGTTIVLRSDNQDKTQYPDIEISEQNHNGVRISRVTKSIRSE